MISGARRMVCFQSNSYESRGSVSSNLDEKIGCVDNRTYSQLLRKMHA